MGTSDGTWSWPSARSPDRSNCKTTREGPGLEGREREGENENESPTQNEPTGQII